MAMQILILWKNEDDLENLWTPETRLAFSIEDAVDVILNNEDCFEPVKAIDISDLADIEDVTEQVAEAYVRSMAQTTALDNITDYLMDVDLEPYKNDIQDNIDSHFEHQKQVQQQWNTDRI